VIAPIREIYEEESAEPTLSETARAAAAALLPPVRDEESVPAVPAWQAWLLVAWMVATGAAYVAITLGWTR
jgi:hypothetical protein